MSAMSANVKNIVRRLDTTRSPLDQAPSFSAIKTKLRSAEIEISMKPSYRNTIA